MARPPRQGLDYFSIDVDFETDEKIVILEAEHGDAGGSLWWKLLARLYKVGLCFRWDEVARRAFAAQVRKPIGEIETILKTMLDVGLFDRSVFESTGYLTSKGIQRRYVSMTIACRRTVLSVPPGVLLLPACEIPSELKTREGQPLAGVFSEKTQTEEEENLNKNKSKESKSKEFPKNPEVIRENYPSNKENTHNHDGNEEVIFSEKTHFAKVASTIEQENGEFSQRKPSETTANGHDAITTITQVASSIPTVSICLNETLTARGMARVEAQNSTMGLAGALNDKCTSEPSDQFETMAEIRLEAPAEQPWTRENSFMIGGRRPMKKYPLIRITKGDLAEAFRSWTRSSIPQDRWKEILITVESKLRSYQEQGRPLDSVNPFNWLIGWARADMVKLLGDEARHDKFS